MNPTVTHGHVTESSYQTDMGKDGEIPRNRRVWYKTGMSSTTIDLFDGTTKATYQVRSLAPSLADTCAFSGRVLCACGQ